MHLLKRALVVTLIIGTAVTGFALHAEEKKPAAKPAETAADAKAKLRQEYQKFHKEEYLKMAAERENYFTTMATEWKAVHKACAGENKDTCKQAQNHLKATREKLEETRKANSEEFKKKADEYRAKMGKAAPTAVEKEHKALKDAAAKKAAAAAAPVPADKKE